MPVTPGRPGAPPANVLTTDEELAAAVEAHRADTTSVHGITDTSVLATSTTLATAVSNHSSDTTSVHGITDTEILLEDVALAFAGHRAAVESAVILRCELDEIAEPTPDGRTVSYVLLPTTSQSYGVKASNDTVKVKNGDGCSKKFTITGAETSQVALDPPRDSPSPDPLTFTPGSIVRAWVWVDDPSALTYVGFNLHSTSGLSDVWQRTSIDSPVPLHYGWNLLSWEAHDSSLTSWGTVYRCTILWSTTAATTFNIDSLWVEAPQKAGVILVEDRGYKTFYDVGVPDMRALDAPITWALDPDLLGSFPGTAAEAITEANVATVYAAGDDVTIHSFSGATYSTMTDEEVRRDTLRAVKWLQDNGYRRGWQYRPSYVHSVPEWRASSPYFVASATTNEGTGLMTWPFVNRHNVVRTILHSATTEALTALFENLETTKGLMIAYTHGIHADGGADCTPAKWDAFIDLMSGGITEGWLEPTSFSRLLDRSGGTLRSYANPTNAY